MEINEDKEKQKNEEQSLKTKPKKAFLILEKHNDDESRTKICYP